MLSIRFETMGCHASALLDADGQDARAALTQLPEWFAARERTLSRFQADSALSRLNASGFARGADDVLWKAIDVAIGMANATDGLVTPTVLNALEAAGYDRSFDRMSRDQEGPPHRTDAVAGWRRIRRDAAAKTIQLPQGVRLDLGGTAKGWCADAAAAELVRFGRVLVDVGGDMAARGAAPKAWPIAIADPRGGTEPLDLVLFGTGGIATSGRDYRRWQRSGAAMHHIIDPRTGAPARSDVLTATVLAPSALEADAFAKRLLLMGSAAGVAWVESRPELAALVVRDDGTVVRTSCFANYAWKEAA